MIEVHKKKKENDGINLYLKTEVPPWLIVLERVEIIGDWLIIYELILTTSIYFIFFLAGKEPNRIEVNPSNSIDMDTSSTCRVGPTDLAGFNFCTVSFLPSTKKSEQTTYSILCFGTRYKLYF